MKEGASTNRRGIVVCTLGITQTLAWGSTYYLPAVFADPISLELHLSHAWFFGSSPALCCSPAFFAHSPAASSTGMAAGTCWQPPISSLRPGSRSWRSRPAPSGLGGPGPSSASAWASASTRQLSPPSPALRPRRAQRDHRHHAICRLRQHRRLADQRYLHRRLRLARRLPRLGRAASTDRSAAEPAAGAKSVTARAGVRDRMIAAQPCPGR